MKLIDDGTLDTVLRCSCGSELRYTFQECDPRSRGRRVNYARFVEWAIKDARDTHECPQAGIKLDGEVAR